MICDLVPPCPLWQLIQLTLPGRVYRFNPADAPQIYKKICSSLESGFQGAVECEAALTIT